MKQITIIMLLSILFLTACEKDISILMPQYTNRVSIQCGLEVGAVPKVFFYSTVPYFDVPSLRQAFVNGANVKISNATETDSLTIDSTYNYLKCEFEYYYQGKIPIKTNQNYQLKIVSKGETYKATTKTNLVPVTIDSIGYTQQFSDIYGEHEGVIPYFHDNTNLTNYYRYEMKRDIDTTMKYREGKIYSPCIGGGKVTVLELGRSVYNNANLSNSQIKIVIEPAYSHKAGMVGIVRIQTIDKVTFDFFDQLDKQKLGQTNPFVEPLFLIDGQFGKKAVGYFGSIVKSQSVEFIFPE